MKKLLSLLIPCVLHTTFANSQGCIIVRNISGFGQYNFADNAFSTSDWQLNITNRYFKSFRDFIGTTEQRVGADSININHIYTLDISLIRMMNNGWSLNFNLPISYNNRSSKLEHGGFAAPRHVTHSFGIGDTRLTVSKWLLKPSVSQKINVQLALGIKLPTGDYKYQDYFYRKEDSAILAPVNPSIQLGDGGTGIVTELNAFYIINKTFSLYSNFYYLINPREQNGTSNLLGRDPTAPASISLVKAGGAVNSVPDQYSIRAGAYIDISKVSFSAGIRYEGIPVYDLLGGSNGGRRAGYNFSIEPGFLYKLKNAILYAYVPVIIGREIKQSVSDKKETEITGKYKVRQGGFANYLVFVGVSLKL